MKNILKIFLIIIIVYLGIIILDTLQARIFKQSPIISWKQTLEDEDSWVDRGLIIDTYYCTKEKDIITVNWKFKGSKFTCPIDNDSKIIINEKDKELIKLLRKKMIEDNILVESNLDTFDVLSISDYGYYKAAPQKKYVEFKFIYTCKDKNNKCITESAPMYSTISNINDYYIIWAYTDEEKIYELSSGVSIGFDDDFVFTNNVRDIIGVIK